MSRLKFEDIDEWTPSSISIVDVPAHPLCKFEVYEDDEEYVKKSIEIKNYEGETMTEEPKVEVTEGFLERLLGRSILKSEEEEQETPAKEEKEEDDSLAKLEARITKLEQEIAELKKEDSSEPTPGAVTKSEGEGEGEAEGEVAETSEETEAEAEAEEEEKEEVLDETEVVSKSIDPDLVSNESETRSLIERTGRKSNGMTW